MLIWSSFAFLFLCLRKRHFCQLTFILLFLFNSSSSSCLAYLKIFTFRRCRVFVRFVSLNLMKAFLTYYCCQGVFILSFVVVLGGGTVADADDRANIYLPKNRTTRNFSKGFFCGCVVAIKLICWKYFWCGTLTFIIRDISTIWGEPLTFLPLPLSSNYLRNTFDLNFNAIIQMTKLLIRIFSKYFSKIQFNCKVNS